MGSPSDWDLGERVRAPVAQPRGIVKPASVRRVVFSETSLSLGVSSSHVSSGLGEVPGVLHIRLHPVGP